MPEDEVWWDSLSEGQSFHTPGQSEAGPGLCRSLSIGWEQAQKGRVHRQGGLDNGNPKAKGRAKKGTFHGVYLGGWETGKEIKLESKSSQPVLSRPRERL